MRAAESRNLPMPTRRPTTRSAPAARVREQAALRDAFFRHMVANMRNGVLAITRTGEVVLINDEACRIFALPPGDGHIGQNYADVLRDHPDMVRVVGGAFEMQSLPNRAELRLKSTDTVLGYTLSLIRDDEEDVVGAAVFFKDLTHVEQLEERERLRDRLAAVGEMAATVAHEIKNPLAGIEVMAGLLRRQVPDRREVQSIVADIINEAKMANAIVQEVLDFVRPVRLQLDRTSLPDALQNAVTMADGKAKRGSITVDFQIPPTLPSIQGDQHQLMQVFANLLINAYEALDGKGSITLRGRLVHTGEEGALLPDGHVAVPTVVVEVADTGPGFDKELADKIFNPFFTTKP